MTEETKTLPFLSVPFVNEAGDHMSIYLSETEDGRIKYLMAGAAAHTQGGNFSLKEAQHFARALDLFLFEPEEQ